MITWSDATSETGTPGTHPREAAAPRVALEAVSVTGEVLGGRSRVKVAQRYRNAESRAIEAVYTFPLPSDATVIGFAMTCGGRRIEAEVRERDEAFRAYDDAISAGHGAALLEQERRDVFTCNVGNVLPGEEVTAEIEYVQRLVADEGAVRMVIPTLVAPRYVPGVPAGDRTAHGAASPTDQVPDADRVSPPVGDARYRVTLDLAVRIGAGASVRSPSHRIDTRHEGDTVRVAFADDAVPLDRDVVLAIETSAAERGRPLVALHATKGDRGYFAATFVPDLFDGGAHTAPLDVVFVLDRSGSMGGASIVEARRALRLCLRNLREGDRFTILAFDNEIDTYSDTLVPLTQRTLERADAWLESVDARGGTELLAPMLRAVDLAARGVVVLLTDGQVANEDAIEAQVLARADGARIYGFGIGTNVSDALLASLAKRTNGALERIHPGERIDEKVTAVFARAVAARVSHVRVTVRGAIADELSPLPPPDVIDGEPWTIFGRYDGAGPGAIEIRGKRRGESFFLEVPVDFAAEATDPVVARFWAAERVRDLESIDLAGRRAQANKARIVAIATAHRIASRYTSFVAVEKRTGDRVSQGMPETRVVPVSAPAGWAMARPAPPPMAAGGFAMPAPAAAAPPPFAQSATRGPASGGPPPVMTRMKALLSSAAPPDEERARVMSIDASVRAPQSPMPSGPMRGSAPQAPSATAIDPVAELFASQLVSGLWRDGDDAPRALLEATLRALRVLLARGLTRESPLLARYGVQLAKTAAAVVPLLAAADPALAPAIVAALLLLVPSPRAQRDLERAAAAWPEIPRALGDTAKLRGIAVTP